MCINANPGLAPWAMQEYRPYRALLRPHQLLAYSDALVFATSLIKCWLICVWAVGALVWCRTI